ncbi:hypothetical protein KP509_12G051900 [Ceratopteris richardii]|uniref:Uncharacterized protein n=1 Tax=Ceratopteris richardii TaxID=49495 RepID=A0A8T2TL17_CERRI|nr:hypothetical protein KP509_12G051900 [Ceratopteris richardii]
MFLFLLRVYMQVIMGSALLISSLPLLSRLDVQLIPRGGRFLLTLKTTTGYTCFSYLLPDAMLFVIEIVRQRLLFTWLIF